MAVITRLTDWIGSTPLLQLDIAGNQWKLILKVEKFNPGGSMKDRMALGMIEAAELRGSLKPGGIIVESSSGNTGTGLAMIAAEKGYRFIAVVDHQTSDDKVRSMRAYGAEIVRIGAARAGDKVATAEREALALQIAQQTPGAILMAQHENPANAESYDSLAEDLSSELARIDLLIGSVGTGGSLCGTAAGLRRRGFDTHVIGVEPLGSTVFGGEAAGFYQSGTGVPGDVDIGTVIDYSLIDQGFVVDDIAAFNTCRFLARRFGLLVGGSAGGIIYTAAHLLAKRSGSGTCLVLVPDGGEKYLDTIFNDDWLASNNLVDHHIDIELAHILRSAHNDFDTSADFAARGAAALVGSASIHA